MRRAASEALLVGIFYAWGPEVPFVFRFFEKCVFSVSICVFLGASSCSRLLGVLGRSRGAPGALLDTLLGAPAAPSEHSAAKEVRRYATICENLWQVRDFLKLCWFLRESLVRERDFWRVSISP